MAAAPSLDPPEVADQPEEESELPEEDREDEPVIEEPTAAEIVRAGVTEGELNVVSIDQRELDTLEEQLIQQFA